MRKKPSPIVARPGRIAKKSDPTDRCGVAGAISISICFVPRLLRPDLLLAWNAWKNVAMIIDKPAKRPQPSNVERRPVAQWALLVGRCLELMHKSRANTLQFICWCGGRCAHQAKKSTTAAFLNPVALRAGLGRQRTELCRRSCSHGWRRLIYAERDTSLVI